MSRLSWTLRGGLVVAMVALLAPSAFAVALPSDTLTPVPQTAGPYTPGQHVTVNIQLSDLYLGTITGGIDVVGLQFTGSPGLNIGTFTRGAALSDWLDLSGVFNYSYLSGTNITSNTTLGTLDVWSNAAGTYTLNFSTVPSATQLAGSGEPFASTLNSASLTFVPEPVSATLLLGGLGVLLRRRK